MRVPARAVRRRTQSRVLGLRGVWRAAAPWMLPRLGCCRALDAAAPGVCSPAYDSCPLRSPRVAFSFWRTAATSDAVKNAGARSRASRRRPACVPPVILDWAFAPGKAPGATFLYLSLIRQHFYAPCICGQESVRTNGLKPIHCVGNGDQLSVFVSEVCRCTCICACRTAKVA